MTIELDAPATTPLSQILHPLDPLSAREISAAVAILRTSGKLGSNVRFATVVLQEPAKEVVPNFKAGDPIEREAFAIILDNRVVPLIVVLAGAHSPIMDAHSAATAR